MASIFSETWTGSNGAAWPAQWTKSGSQTTDIQSNAGRIVSGTTAYAATAMRNATALSATDYTGLVKVKVPNTTNGGWYYFLHFRGSSTFAGGPVSLASSYEFRLYWSAPSLVLEFYEVNASGTKTYRNSAGNLSGVLSAGDFVWLRWEVAGNPTSMLRYRMWKDGSSEPGTWTNDWSSSVVANNQGAYVALIGQAGDATSEDLAFDSFDIDAAGGSPLVADFTASVGTLRAGAPVSFTDTSTPTPTSWTWDFGDGSAPVADSPSGSPIPAYDLAGWRLAQSHDFGTAHAVGSFGPLTDNVPAEFAGLLHLYEDGWRDTASSSGVDPSLPSRYMPSQVLSTANGQMVWHLFNDGSGARSAAVQVGGNQLYGRYAFRYKADALDGFKTAVLLWPGSDVWPRDGEIDFPEGALDGVIEGYMHRQGATSGGDQDFISTSGARPQVWHTCVIEWKANSLKFFLDGVQQGSTLTSRVPNTPMHYVLQIESDLGGNQPPVGTSGYLYCDWVCRWTDDPTATDKSGSTGSSLENPTHVYTQPGTYNVTLTATLSGVTATHTTSIVVQADVTGGFGTYPGAGITLADATSAISGTQTVAAITGTSAVPLEDATMAAAGTVTQLTVTGTWASTLADATAVAVGQMGSRTVLVMPALPDVKSPGAPGAFAKFRGAQREKSILKIGGVYIAVSPPTTDQLAVATEVYLGGHVHELTPAQAAALTEAGFTVRVE